MSTKILAVDPGFAATGLAVLDKLPNDEWQTVELACIRTKKRPLKVGVRVADDDVSRVQEMACEISRVLKRHEIFGVLVELPNGGAKSAQACRAMALASAMIATLVEIHELSVEYYSPRETRLAAGVPASMRKHDDVKELVMAAMAKRYPQLAEIKTKAEREHIADALSTFEAGRRGNLVRSIA